MSLFGKKMEEVRRMARGESRDDAFSKLMDSMIDDAFGRGTKNAEAMRQRTEERYRDGVEAGFAIARKHVASMLRQEGYVEMATKVEAITIERKRGK